MAIQVHEMSDPELMFHLRELADAFALKAATKHDSEDAKHASVLEEAVRRYSTVTTVSDGWFCLRTADGQLLSGRLTAAPNHTKPTRAGEDK